MNVSPRVVLSLILLHLGHVASAADEPLKLRVLNEYPKAYSELEKSLMVVRGEGRYEKRSRIGRANETTSRGRFVFSRDNQLRELETRSEAVTKKTSSDPTVPATNEATDQSLRDIVMCIGPEYSFRIVRKVNSEDFTIDYLDKEPKPIVSPLFRFFSCFVDCGAYARAFTVAPFLSLAWTSIDRVTSSRDPDGLELLKVEFSVDDSKRPPPKVKSDRPTRKVKEGYIILCPDQKWVVREYVMKYPAPYGFFNNVGTITYGKPLNGVPAPSRVVIKDIREISDPALAAKFEAQPGEDLVESFEITKIDTQTMPPSHYSITRFGLPEVGGAAPPKAGMRRGILWLVASILIILVAVYLRRSVISKGKTSVG